jgi:hypothetical protein
MPVTHTMDIPMLTSALNNITIDDTVEKLVQYVVDNEHANYGDAVKLLESLGIHDGQDKHNVIRNAKDVINRQYGLECSASGRILYIYLASWRLL